MPNQSKHTPVKHRAIKAAFILMSLSITLATIWAVMYSQQKLTSRTDTNFNRDTKTTTKTFVDNMEKYNGLLYSARSLVTSGNTVTQNSWNNFFASQSATDRYPGVSSIFYVKIVSRGERELFEQTLRQDPYFGPDFSIESTNTSAKEYAVANLIYSNNDVRGQLGFDNFSTADRRLVYKKAAQLNKPTASPPLKLATGPLGFVIALPVFDSQKTVDGYVAVSFRANDLVASVFKEEYEHIVGKIIDITDTKNPITLFGSQDWDEVKEELTYIEKINIAGRTWQITYKSHRSYDSARINQMIPRLIMLVGLLLSGLVGLIFYINDPARKQKHTP